jgi:hypothetical protein
VLTITSKCAWCNKLLKRVTDNFTNGVSHGICSACKKRIIEDYYFLPGKKRLNKTSACAGNSIGISNEIRFQDEQLIIEQAGLEKDIEKLFKQVRLLDNKHLRLIFIRAARHVISSLIRTGPANFRTPPS